jgi:hypothetical protein
VAKAQRLVRLRCGCVTDRATVRQRHERDRTEAVIRDVAIRAAPRSVPTQTSAEPQRNTFT